MTPERIDAEMAGVSGDAQSDSMQICALLHFSDEAGNSVNLDTTRGRLYEVLVGNIISLHRSLQALGLHLNVVTNDIQRVEALFGFLGLMGSRPNLLLRKFNLRPPTGIKFYSSHFKLDLFEMFAECPDQIFMLLDSDMLVLRRFPSWLSEVARRGAIVNYDIIKQVGPSFGLDRITRDLKVFHPSIEIPHWFGGEFICAKGATYAQLSARIKQFWPSYCAQYEQLHHHGDEMIVTAAAQSLAASGVELVDAGARGLIRRFWSVKTNHPQKPLTDSAELCLLHLPADKSFLAKMKESDFLFGAKGFWRSYGLNWRIRRAGSILKAFVVGIVGVKKH